MYRNGNHFDALIKEDDPLITRGTIANTPVLLLNKTVAGEEVSKKPDNKIKKDSNKVNNSGQDVEYVQTLRNKLQQSENSVMPLESNYKGTEVAIKELTTESPMLKIRVKDLFEIASTCQKREIFYKF